MKSRAAKQVPKPSLSTKLGDLIPGLGQVKIDQPLQEAMAWINRMVLEFKKTVREASEGAADKAADEAAILKQRMKKATTEGQREEAEQQHDIAKRLASEMKSRTGWVWRDEIESLLTNEQRLFMGQKRNLRGEWLGGYWKGDFETSPRRRATPVGESIPEGRRKVTNDLIERIANYKVSQLLEIADEQSNEAEKKRAVAALMAEWTIPTGDDMAKGSTKQKFSSTDNNKAGEVVHVHVGDKGTNVVPLDATTAAAHRKAKEDREAKDQAEKDALAAVEERNEREAKSAATKSKTEKKASKPTSDGSFAADFGANDSEIPLSDKQLYSYLVMEKALVIGRRAAGRKDHFTKKVFLEHHAAMAKEIDKAIDAAILEFMYWYEDSLNEGIGQWSNAEETRRAWVKWSTGA